VFEDEMLRRTFGPKREEVAGGKRKLHNEELRNQYISSNINVHAASIFSQKMEAAWTSKNVGILPQHYTALQP
jgi:hypothetical protein